MATTATNSGQPDFSDMVDGSEMGFVDDGDDKSPGRNQEMEQLSKITNVETKAVSGLRVSMLFALVAFAVLASLGIYFFTFNEEERSFVSQFESDAMKMFEDIGRSLDLTMGAADAFTVRVISQVKSTKSVWPFVTIPDWAVQSAKLIVQTDSIYVALYPLITQEERADWENFTKYNDDWVEEALEVQANNPNFHGPILKNYTKSHAIWDLEGPVAEDHPGPFLASWLGSPVIPYYYPYNWNGLAYEAFSRGYVHSMETKSVVMTPVANHADPNDPVAVNQAATTSDWATPYLDEGEDPNEPFADMYYPIIDDIDNVVVNPDGGARTVGIVGFSFFWNHILRNILPPNSVGLVLVFDNPCGNQSFTYQVDGAVPSLLGFGDNHEAKDSFEQMAVSKTLRANKSEWKVHGASHDDRVLPLFHYSLPLIRHAKATPH